MESEVGEGGRGAARGPLGLRTGLLRMHGFLPRAHRDRGRRARRSWSFRLTEEGETGDLAGEATAWARTGPGGIQPIRRGGEAPRVAVCRPCHNRRRAATIPLRAAAATLLLACGAGAEPEPAPAPRPEAAASPPAIVVELFTSQGCSSCPPADAVLSKLAAAGVAGAEVVPLAFHVDYWDRLGWRDPFSSPAWSARQRRYAAALATGRVYTPQLVVQGAAELNGSRQGAVVATVQDAAATPTAGAVDVEAARDGDRLVVTVGARLAAGHPRPTRLLVAITEDGHATRVGRGENARRTLANDAVVRRLDDVAEVAPGDGAQHRVEVALDPDWDLGRLAVAAFLQEPATMAIVGAGRAQVPGSSRNDR